MGVSARGRAPLFGIEAIRRNVHEGEVIQVDPYYGNPDLGIGPDPTIASAIWEEPYEELE